MITGRKIVSFLALSWGVVLAVSVPFPVYSTVNRYRNSAQPSGATDSMQPLVDFRPDFASCLVNFNQSSVLTSVYAMLGLSLPFSVIVMLNLRIVGIAKNHRFRIANALMGMAISAQRLADGNKVRQQQKDDLQR